ncbi:hypothetical protein OQA88_11067 [Cercophora sp. LCS_1]
MASEQQTPDQSHNGYSLVDDLLADAAAAGSSDPRIGILVTSTANIPINAGYRRFLCFVSSLPVLIAIGFASGATGAPPTDFNLRHAVIIFGVLGSWVISRAIGTMLERRFRSNSDTKQGTFSKNTTLVICLTVKNIVFGLLPVALLSSLTCGGFSGCRFWAPIGLEGFEGVDLLPWEKFFKNIRSLFPPLASSCLGAELGFVPLVVYALPFLGFQAKFGKTKVEATESDAQGEEGSV